MQCISGIGTDLIEISRVCKMVENSPQVLERLFTKNELFFIGHPPYNRAKYILISRMFTIKEAVLKACGTGWQEGVSWHDIEIGDNLQFWQEIKVSGKLESISRDKGIAKINAVSNFSRYYTVAQAISMKYR